MIKHPKCPPDFKAQLEKELKDHPEAKIFTFGREGEPVPIVVTQ